MAELTNSPQNPPRLEMRGVSKRFGATQALDGVDFCVDAGVVHALVGENGAGKSTLMKVLSGAITPDGGAIRLDGEPFRPRHPLDARRQGVAMIYQELSLAPHLTVEDNVMLGIEPSSFGILRRRDIRKRTAAALEQLGHGDIRPDAIVGRLSPAAQQIVEIARSLVLGCQVLVLDEPTSSLSREDVRRLFQVIRELKERQYTIIYISHFIEEVRQIADFFTILRDGKAVGGGRARTTPPNEIIRMMVGRAVEEQYPRSAHLAGEPILEMAEMTGRRTPRSVSLTLHRGEVLGIAGLVGAGRTEFLRALFGLEPIRAGRVRFGAFSGWASPNLRWRQGMGMLSEDRKNEGLATRLSVADNLTLSRLHGLGRMGFVSPSRQLEVAAGWTERIGIRCRNPAQRVSDLSGGNQQKLAFARLLYHGVDVLLLDEPTRGIDVGSKAQIYELIDRLVVGGEAGAKPRAILLVSSYLPELLGVCDRVAVMCRGRLGPARPVNEYTEESLMAEAIGMGAQEDE